MRDVRTHLDARRCHKSARKESGATGPQTAFLIEEERSRSAITVRLGRWTRSPSQKPHSESNGWQISVFSGPRLGRASTWIYRATRLGASGGQATAARARHRRGIARRGLPTTASDSTAPPTPAGGPRGPEPTQEQKRSSWRGARRRPRLRPTRASPTTRGRMYSKGARGYA